MSAKSEDITVRCQDGAFNAYAAIPTAPKNAAIVVLQEIFGVNANIRQTVDDFAAAGYPAVAPNLYWRLAPDVQLNPASDEDRARAMDLSKQMDRNQAVADAVATLAALRASVSGVTRTAAIGYCFGGGVAYLMAARNLVDAGISYYGTALTTMLEEAKGLQSHLLLHIAETDHLCPPEAQQAISAALAPLGERAKIITHANAGHAFARRGGATFNQGAADHANAETMALLATLAARR